MQRGKYELNGSDRKAQKERRYLRFTENVLAYLHDFSYVLGILLIVLLLCFRVVVVSGSSMNDTLIDGDYLVLLSSPFCGYPQNGDIVVASKDSFENGEPIIKRVIAVEGQVVDIDFSSGTVYVDGVALKEDYIRGKTTLDEGTKFPLTVDKGCVFVLGDHRGRSQDSRSPAIGLIDYREILGEAFVLFMPGVDESTGARDFHRIGGLS